MLITNPALFRRLQWHLWLFQGLLFALLFPAYTSWSLAMFALLLLAKLLQLYRGGKAWSLGYSNLLAGAMLVALLLSARQLGVMHLMFHFLLLAAVLRLLGLESTKPRDLIQLVWVHYFLIACAFILHQNLWLAAVIFIGFGLNLYVQYLSFCTQWPVFQWRRVSQTSLLLLTVTGLIFVLFPRLPPLWQLPGAKLTQTGLADNLAPGSVASLLQSNSLAFRVSFDNQAPPAAERYFRAKIYDVFDGNQWRAQRPQPRGQLGQTATTTYSYTVIAEPHQQFSLFALGLPQQHSANTVLNHDGLLVTEQPLSQRISYQVRSQLSAIPAQGNINRYLQLPAGNPRSRALAQQLKQQASSPVAFAGQVADYFRQQQFRYSLSPGEITGPQIDTFMFDHKLGFCSHYASATVFLFRAAGFPARIVGGYLGGDWQDDEAYLQVLQKDAHAWVEYYQAGQWLRFDPTALIEPALLLEMSSDQSSGEFGGVAGDWMLQRLELWLLQPLRNMDYYWSMWVLSFDSTQQQSLFGQLKDWGRDLRRQASFWWWLTLPALGLLLFWWQRRPAMAPTLKLFQPLLKLKAKQPNQSYEQYLQLWSQQYPMLAPDIERLLQAYLRWQFGNEPQGYAEAHQAIGRILAELKHLKS